MDPMGFPGCSVTKNLTANAEDAGLIPDWEDPLQRKWQCTSVFLPGKSRGERRLVGYSPWGLKRVRHDFVNKQQQEQHGSNM